MNKQITMFDANHNGEFDCTVFANLQIPSKEAKINLISERLASACQISEPRELASLRFFSCEVFYARMHADSGHMHIR